jgi:hypothetical protein
LKLSITIGKIDRLPNYKTREIKELIKCYSINYITIRLQAKMTVKPLSPMYIWVHIIENENQGYRKRDYSKMVAKLSTTINKIQNLSNYSNSKILDFDNKRY